MLSLVLIYKVVPAISSTTATKSEYVILAANDLGMHCIQSDYSAFLILPPANNVRVQVFKKTNTNESKLITTGITINYEIVDNTTSADKNNFWQYAKDYGFDVAPNVGITGNKLSGEMKLSDDKKFFEATAIPVTPYTDSDKTKLQPYQIAKMTVTNTKTKETLAIADSVVVPVSDEMDCNACHGKNDTNLNILASHDKLSGTNLVADLKNNIRHKCAECHKDNAIGAQGKEGIEPLSEAMHEFHAGKMNMTDIKPSCNSCHPGPITQCNRGAMKAAGISCENEKCHGSMKTVANSQKNGREAWLSEPNCSNCHGATFSANKDTLYRNSFLQNSPARNMNNLILCISCHNSPHAEWVSTLPIDNALPISIMGHEGFIDECSVCHKGSGTMHKKENAQ